MLDNVMRQLLIVAWVVVPSIVLATEPLILPKEDSATQTKRFIALDGASAQGPESQNGVTIIREKKFIPLRTDKRSMSNGMLLTDRVPTGTLGAPLMKTSVKPAAEDIKSADASDVKVTHEMEPESDGIEGDTETINPVLALFGDQNDTPVGSFSEVMRGAGAASIAGLVRHAMWPIPLSTKQYVSSLYGIRNDPFHGRPTFHGGIDIAADTGTAVLATAAGEVVEVKEDNRFGKYVGIKHADGMLSRYGHLNSQSVSVGQRVRAGQLIGAVGSTGRSTGAHLDYRISKNGVKYDPLAVLTVPTQVAVKASGGARSVAAARPEVQVFRGNNVASSPTPKRPMVIQVR